MNQSNRAQLIAPLAVMGARWAVRAVLDATYRRGTGTAPPNKNRNSTLTRAILWAVTTAALVAAIEVVVTRALTSPEVSVSA